MYALAFFELAAPDVRPFGFRKDRTLRRTAHEYHVSTPAHTRLPLVSRTTLSDGQH